MNIYIIRERSRSNLSVCPIYVCETKFRGAVSLQLHAETADVSFKLQIRSRPAIPSADRPRNNRAMRACLCILVAALSRVTDLPLIERQSCFIIWSPDR